MKSFIETQRALLAEIQNGCKRNFILAKEKEETEQKMRQSASMAEIATEDGTGAEEETGTGTEGQGGKEGGGGGEEGDGDGEPPRDETQTSSLSALSSQTNIPPMNLDSDSDTEDEEEEEVVTKAISVETVSQTQTGVPQPPFSASHTSAAASPTAGPNAISGITVTESPVPPGTPPSPGRCISVSSPGRGHKIFMVTRVESPPEQKQLQLNTRAPDGQVEEVSTKSVDAPAAQAPARTQPVQEGVGGRSPAPAGAEHVQSSINTKQTHMLQPQSAGPPAENVLASTLDPEVKEPPALPVSSSPVQAGEPQLPRDRTERASSPQPELAEQQVAEDNKEEEKMRKDLTEEERQVMAGDSTGGRCEPSSSLEQQQSESASSSEETVSINQTKTEDEPLPLSVTGAEGPSDRDEAGQHPESITGPLESVSPADEASESLDQALSSPTAESGSKSHVDTEESPDGREGECSAEALIGLEGGVVGSAVRNGLKPEFSLHLLDPESPKPGSCVMEHGESLSFSRGRFRYHSSTINSPVQLFFLYKSRVLCVTCVVSVSCTQDLEELLLEASLDTGRDAP